MEPVKVDKRIKNNPFWRGIVPSPFFLCGRWSLNQYLLVFYGKTIDTICVNWYYYMAVRTDLIHPWRQIDNYVIVIIGSVCGNSSAVEHRLAKAGVASSNLVSRSIHSSIAQSVEQSAVNRSVVGSSPTRGAIWLTSSVGRATDWKSVCRQFDSVLRHHLYAGIAQR